MKHFNKILLTIICLLFVLGGYAQTGNTVTGSHEMCEGEVLPVKLDDIVNLGLSAGGGSWHEVNPADNSIIEEDVSNVFLGINRLPGTYKFIFVPKNNPCMEDEDRAEATIEILETPKPLSHYITLCSGETINFDLATLISQSLKDKYTISYKDADGNALASSSISIDTEGELFFTYELGGASDLCNNNASIVLSVISDDMAAGLTFDEGLAFCVTAVPESLNLNDELGLTGKNGTWEATGGAPAITDGVIDLTNVVVGDYVYAYKWTDCSGVEQTNPFTVSITDDLSNDFVDVERESCKTINSNGFIELLDVIGVGLPANSGVWTVEVAVDGTAIDVADGIFEIADSRVGQYVYRYTVSNAVDLCGIQGMSATVTLNVYDSGEVLDGEVQLCKANLTAGTSLDLAGFMQNLPVGGTWYDLDGTTALTGSSIDAGSLDIGVYSYKYEFASGPCGNGDAELLVVVTDVLTNFKDKTKSYCLTDAGADQIDLDAILSVGNIEGTWTNTDNATNFDSTTNVFDGAAEGVGEYSFTFKATAEGCGVNVGDEVVIKIIITDDLTQ
ncbi:hypothetical protein ACRTDU_02695 [Sunxiuqinia elliptica]